MGNVGGGVAAGTFVAASADKEVAEAGEFVYVMHIYAKMTLFLGSICYLLLIF